MLRQNELTRTIRNAVPARLVDDSNMQCMLAAVGAGALAGCLLGRKALPLVALTVLGAGVGFLLGERAGCDEVHETPDEMIEADPVDEASWESFPASDPPSFNVRARA